MRYRILLMITMTIAACSRSEREVVVEVAIPGADSVDAPVAHLAVLALPYNRDSLLRLMDSGRAGPEAVVRSLDSLFEVYREPFLHYAEIAYALRQEEDRITGLRKQVDSLTGDHPDRDSVSRELVASEGRLLKLRQRREAARHLLTKLRATYTPKADSLRRLVAAWRDTTYRGWDSLTRALGKGLRRAPQSDTTDAMGQARFRLPQGEWWIHARSWDAWDPNREWYWNVRVTGPRATLDRASGRRLPRY